MRNGGSLFEADPFRFERSFVFPGDGELSVAALFLKTEIRVNRIAGFEFGDVGADFLDYSGDIHSGNEWKLTGAEKPGANESIYRIHARRHRANQDFVVLWFRSRGVFILQYLGTTVFVNDDRLHRRPA